jgi:hypothetical protein
MRFTASVMQAHASLLLSSQISCYLQNPCYCPSTCPIHVLRGIFILAQTLFCCLPTVPSTGFTAYCLADSKSSLLSLQCPPCEPQTAVMLSTAIPDTALPTAPSTRFTALFVLAQKSLLLSPNCLINGIHSILSC